MKMINNWIAMGCAAFGLGLVSGPAMALEIIPAPEPGVLSLLGAGMVLVLAAAIRNRRK